MTKKNKMSVLFVFILGTIALTGLGYSKFQAKKEAPATVTSQLSSNSKLFSKTSLNLGTVSLADYKGKIIIVDFFATWCPPCVAEIPHFISLSQKYKGKIQVIGVSVDELASDVTPFIQTHRISYPVVMSEEQINKAYGPISSIPTTFVFDQDFNLVEKVIGYRDIEYFDDLITKLIKK